ncbi:hypothetical protein N7478_012928 [Penicillium angulare]|uniref:uncharacterized protein n=1 Tax=Penicillium angulare TaxID=116970 RepID=UPI0025410868|nr:uncharacterized protein N7478_012928 [Penicillium angulare]KAJ5256824.1 hypothetical protein N7478_012928 [Penicillium angulare]
MKGAALVCTLLAGVASAHMQMMKPYPIRSPLNKDAKGKKDYSYTNPLQASGSDYPCKGYANDDFDSQATYAPGQSYDMELDGSATHDGGSCQLALTYDQGKSFKVIESMLGDCPIPKKYNFKIPSDAPSGDALLAWTWFNKVGNREMYMNCAMVTIGGDSNGNETDTQTEHTKNHKPAPHEKSEEKAAHPPMEIADSHKAHQQRDAMVVDKQLSFDSLPELFVANVDQAGKCVTVEGEAVNFPEPGDNVMGKVSGKGYKCSGDAPFLGSGDSDSSNKTEKTDKNEKTDKKDDKSKSATKEKEANKNATRSTPESMSKIAQAFGTSPAADTRVVGTKASTNNEFSKYVTGWSCTSGEILCSPDGYSWAMCSNGAPIYMGAVAAGMVCRFGAMVTAQW